MDDNYSNKEEKKTVVDGNLLSYEHVSKSYIIELLKIGPIRFGDKVLTNEDDVIAELRQKEYQSNKIIKKKLDKELNLSKRMDSVK